MEWNNLSIPKLEHCYHWISGTDKQFHPAPNCTYEYLSMLGLWGNVDPYTSVGEAGKYPKYVDSCLLLVVYKDMYVVYIIFIWWQSVDSLLVIILNSDAKAFNYIHPNTEEYYYLPMPWIHTSGIQVFVY